MNRWFVADRSAAAFKRSQDVSGVSDLRDLASRVGKVIDGLEADVLTVQEGPSRLDEMALFVDSVLGGRWEIVGPAGKGQQKLYALIRKDSRIIAAHARLEERDGFDFDDVYEVDIDGDLAVDAYRLTRPPLLVDLTLTTGRVIELMTLHAKSKYVHNGGNLWNNPATRPEFIEQALLARRRISAEAMRVRTYLNQRFAKDARVALVVTGDFNDGPGLDFFEQRFLTHDLAGLIAGSPYEPRRMLRHAFVDLVNKEDNYTAIFYDFIEEREKRPLLDHIFVSASLFWDDAGKRATDGTIEHAIWQASVDDTKPGHREKQPSDHRPQSALIQV
ncbi:MAG: endonuclease/exonuclease/phosphatase family protein, partial [Alphaproteobacteria bacterium]